VLVFGILGKEMGASAIALFASPNALLSTAGVFAFTTASLVAFVVFYMLYPPCVANLRAIKVQTNQRTMWGICVLNILVAYFMAFLVYTALVMI